MQANDALDNPTGQTTEKTNAILPFQAAKVGQGRIVKPVI